jgi:serine/threonine protein kinase, bacterial
MTVYPSSSRSGVPRTDCVAGTGVHADRLKTVNKSEQSSNPGRFTVALPTTGANAGKISFYYGAQPAGATMHVVADVVGYTTNTRLIDLVNRLTTLETAGVAGPAGPQGPAGSNGSNGPVEGSACTAGGIAGTVQTSFDATTGLLAVRCSRPGYVATLAGTGSTDRTGTAASFSDPSGVAVDASGNIYVADTNNHLIRKIN